MALPAVLTPSTRPIIPMQSGRWSPGDPIYFPPPDPETATERAIGARMRHGGGRPMVWESANAIPGPWGWLCGPDATGATR